jgi:spore coat polysaccharide biosynthesis protein SpsF
MGACLGIVEVQPAVEGLSEKSPLAGMARRRFGGKSLLEWVVRRMSDADRLDGVVVLAGDDPFSRGLGRFAAAVRHFQCSAAVRLSVSQPFVDPILIDRLLALVASGNTCDYASFALADGRPVTQARLGVFAEWCRGEAILLANRLARRDHERADATRFLHWHPEIFAIRLFPVPPQLDRDDVRLAIQDEEDWEHVQLILDALGPESLDWQFITALIDRQPTIRERMAHRNREEAGAC